MMPIQNREVQGFAPAPTREPGRRVGRDELIKERGDLQAPSHPQDEGQMCYGLNLLYCNGHAAPPVVASWIGSERSAVSDNSSTVLPRKKRVVQPSPLNVGHSDTCRRGAAASKNPPHRCALTCTACTPG
jgi:hypothetical protein